MVSDPQTGLALQIATIQLESLADRELANLIWDGSDGTIGALQDLVGDQLISAGIEISYVSPDLRPPSFEGREDSFKQALTRQIAPVLLRDAEASGVGIVAVSELVDQLLDATVLAEHSSANAIKAVSEVGKATAEGLTLLMGTVVGTGVLNGMGAAVLLLAPAGIVIVGTATTMWIAHMLITHSRGKGPSYQGAFKRFW